MNRYNFKLDGLCKIKIELSSFGEWVKFDDVKHLLSIEEKKIDNSDPVKCPCSYDGEHHYVDIPVCRHCGHFVE